MKVVFFPLRHKLLNAVNFKITIEAQNFLKAALSAFGQKIIFEEIVLCLRTPALRNNLSIFAHVTQLVFKQLQTN